ncbi:juvenile hormone acid O-methyltransferase-like [Ornithodoros turicata]|uniref:juvenile hormone acid O-methyltransferase-like n=1 Tax=Ornithodoros turicata TaxID=34597 RepID=UPI00313A10AE
MMPFLRRSPGGPSIRQWVSSIVLSQVKQTVPQRAAVPLKRKISTSPMSSQQLYLNPEVYNRRHRFQAHHSMLSLELFNAAFKGDDGNQQYLDIGCGDGDFTRNALLDQCQPCGRLIGTDVSEDMIRYAREHFQHPQILHEVLDIGGEVSWFIRKYGTFRRVYSFYALHWLQDQLTCFKNIADLLTPDGECLLFFCGQSNVFDAWIELAKMERWKPYSEVLLKRVPHSHYAEDQRAYIEPLLRAAGLNAHTCEVIGKKWPVHSEQALRDTLTPLLPVTNFVRPEDERHILEDYLRIALAGCRTSMSDALTKFTSYFLVRASKAK